MLLRCSNEDCKHEINTKYGIEVLYITRCPQCDCRLHKVSQDKPDLALPWYAVPAYKGAKGIDGQPHVVDANGELVGLYELMEYAEITARAINLLFGGDDD